MLAFEVADATRQDAPLFSATPLTQPPLQQQPPILTRLRQETRGEHEAVEQVLDLMAASLSHADYSERLKKFYGFYAPLEKALLARSACIAQAPGEAIFSNSIPHALAQRLNKTIYLQQDLHLLGIPTESLPLCRQLPPLETQAEILGCVYVLEGATLGGRMISQHVRSRLGITPTTGGRFFEGYGASTAHMWQAMRQQLVKGAPDVQSENDIVANAIATFAALRRWCQ